MRVTSDILATKPNHFNRNSCLWGIKYKIQAVMAHRGQMSSLSLDNSVTSCFYCVEAGRFRSADKVLSQRK